MKPNRGRQTGRRETIDFRLSVLLSTAIDRTEHPIDGPSNIRSVRVMRETGADTESTAPSGKPSALTASCTHGFALMRDFLSFACPIEDKQRERHRDGAPDKASVHCDARTDGMRPELGPL